MTWIVGFCGGVVLWTLLEYAFHRCVFHRARLGRLLMGAHLQHHARPERFNPFLGKALLAGLMLVPLAMICSRTLGPRWGGSIPLGTFMGWVGFEVLHARIHRRAPLGRVGRWARRHHLRHHFMHPDGNFGVLTPVWDALFGTLAPDEVVDVPRSRAKGLAWLLDRRNAVSELAIDAAFCAEYRLIGSPSAGSSSSGRQAQVRAAARLPADSSVVHTTIEPATVSSPPSCPAST